MGNMPSLDILVVEDIDSVRKAITHLLAHAGYNVAEAKNGEEALHRLQGHYFDLVISDYKMEHINGIELLCRIRRNWPATAVIIITGYGTIAQGVEVMKLGAFDYITKPFDNEGLLLLVSSFVERRKAGQKVSAMSDKVRSLAEFDTIIGKSNRLYAIMQMVAQVAPKESTCMILGESGTGKELIAKSIHYLSGRKEKPFIAINCSAIPETLLESELFGYARGAFTGANEEKEGLLESANGGTVFLDEISDMPLAMQVKLLRCLQEFKIRRIGESFERKVTFRLIAASNKNLTEEIKSGRFRQDLFYRINVIPIEMPALRQRKEDIPLLVDHFVSKYNKNNHSEIKSVSKRSLSMLMNYDWPGNIRELENVIERSVALENCEEITPELLPLEIRDRPDFIELSKSARKLSLAEIEQEVILETLKRMDGSKKQTARELGISKTTLWRKLNK